MQKNNPIQTICNKQMDRKDFLKYSGMAFLSVVGLKGLVALLLAPEKQISISNNKTNEQHGFGSGKYGA